jgi:arylsulfatase A-like enzyme
MLRRLLALMIAGWIAHAILRFAQLARPAPYGSPFVEKFEWYFFHALAYDWLWSLPFILPFLAYYGLRTRPSGPASAPWPGGRGWRLALGLQMAYIAVSSADLEVMRFLSLHLSVGYMRTYLGPAAVADLPAMLAGDAGGVGLPVLLTFGAPVLVLWLAGRIGRRWVKRETPLWRIVGPCLVALVLGYGLLFHFWKGTFRLAKLRPVPATLLMDLTQSQGDRALDPRALGLARDQVRSLWSGGRDDWAFPLESYPIYREPLITMCQRPDAPPRCGLDQDGDGHEARVDCRDDLPGVHPGATEVPSNGLDDDCDGKEEAPWNVVLILLESHRALDTGHLGPHGATGAYTPTLDAMAARPDARVFTRHQVNGLPTIESFFTAHCSMTSKGAGIAATENTSVRLKCLPDFLRERGFKTRFFTASAPDWDNQTYWLSRWYDGYDFDRDRQTDLSMFTHMGTWMVENLSADEPFFVGAITKTNHFPFNPVHDMTEAERAETPRKIGATMAYTERALGAFFEQIEDAPWRERTLFILTADHGFNWGERGYYRLMDPLVRPSTWVPLVIVGDHPELMALPTINDRLSSHVDLAPTILDLLGIHAPNHFMGHSLVDPRSREDAYVFASHGGEMAWEQGDRRALLSPPGRSREDGDQLFDTVADFHLERPLMGALARTELTRLGDRARALWSLTNAVYRRDRIWPVQGSPQSP